MQVSSTVWPHFPAGRWRLLLQQNWLKTKLLPTAVNLLAKINDQQTRQMLSLLTLTHIPYPRPLPRF